MTINQKLEQARKTPDTEYVFSARWVEHYPPVLYEKPRSIRKNRGLFGRLRDYRDGVLYIDIGSSVETLQFEHLKDIYLPDGMPMTQNKMGFDV